jgi:chromosome segregation ATPase
MTELEKQLLSALEQLQQDYSKRLDEWESAFAEWRTMSGLMQRENAALSERVTGLSRQVQSLSEQLRRLSTVEYNRTAPAAQTDQRDQKILERKSTES